MSFTHKLISLLMAGFLTLNQIGLASGISPSEVKVPKPLFNLSLPPHLGAIQNLISGSGPTVIHIQTAHGNYDAQKKIQAILHYLKNTYGFKLLLLEGSAAKLNPELLRYFPENRDRTMKIADELTKEALVKGDELFLLESPETDAYGIEDVSAYRKNREAFKAVLLEQEKTQGFLRDLDTQIERLTGPYLPKDLRMFLRRLEDYETNGLPLFDWLTYLKKEAKQQLELDLTDPRNQIDWPILLRIFKLQEFEKKIDRLAFEKERDLFLKKIRGLQFFKEINTLLHLPLSHNDLPDPETALLFEKMVSYLPHNFPYESYPNVKLFIAHLILQSEISATNSSADPSSGGKGEGLFEETNRLSDKISERLAKTEEEKKILSLFKDYRLLKKLFALELTSEDYDVIARRADLASPKRSSGFAEARGPTKQSKIGNDSLKPSQMTQRFLNLNNFKRIRDMKFSHLDEIDSLYEKALQFYQGTKERDHWMLENIESRLKETRQDKAVIITGGFHAHPFGTYFQKQNFNYALIAPHITSTEGHEAYIQAALQNSTMDLPRRMEPLKMQIALGENINWVEESIEKVLRAEARVAIVESDVDYRLNSNIFFEKASEISNFFNTLSHWFSSRFSGMRVILEGNSVALGEFFLRRINQKKTFVLQGFPIDFIPVRTMGQQFTRQGGSRNFIHFMNTDQKPFRVTLKAFADSFDFFGMFHDTKNIAQNTIGVKLPVGLDDEEQRILQKLLLDFNPTLRSEARVAIVDLLGLKSGEKVEGELIPVDPIPPTVLEPAEKLLKARHPELYKIYETLGKFYEKDMKAAAAIGDIYEQRVFYLNQGFYENLAEGVTEEARSLLIYLHLVSLLSQEATEGNELTKSLIAFIAQITAYHRLTKEDKELVNEAAILFDSQEPDPTRHRFVPTITFMNQFDQDSILKEENHLKVIEFMTQYLGLDRNHYTSEEVSLSSSRLPQPSAEGPLSPFTQETFAGQGTLHGLGALNVHNGILYVSSKLNEQILRYDLEHERPLAPFDRETFDQDRETAFGGLAVHNEILHIASSRNNQILRYDLERQSLRSPLTREAFEDKFMTLAFPNALYVHNRILYIGNSGNFILRYNLQSKRPLSPLTYETFEGQGGILNGVRSFTVYNEILYIGIQQAQQILRYDLEHERPLPPLTQETFKDQGTLHGSTGLTVDNGILYITSWSEQILRYDLEHEIPLSPLTQETFKDQGTLKSPHGLTVDNGILYIASSGSNQILRYKLGQRSEVRAVDLLGMKPGVKGGDPIPLDEIPKEVFELAEDLLGKYYPDLDKIYKKLAVKFYAKEMKGAASLDEIEGAQVLNVDRELYQDLPEGVSEEARSLLIYLHLVSLLSQEATEGNALTKHLIAFMNQALACYQLSPEQKELVRKAIEVYEKQGREDFKTVFNFIEKYDAKTLVFAKNRKAIVKFVTKQLGVNQGYDAELIKKHLKGLTSPKKAKPKPEPSPNSPSLIQEAIDFLQRHRWKTARGGNFSVEVKRDLARQGFANVMGFSRGFQYTESDQKRKELFEQGAESLIYNLDFHDNSSSDFDVKIITHDELSDPVRLLTDFLQQIPIFYPGINLTDAEKQRIEDKIAEFQRSEIRTDQQGLEILMEEMRSYYTAKTNLMNAFRDQNHGEYEKAFKQMEQAAKAAALMDVTPEDLRQALEKMRGNEQIQEALLGDAGEIIFASGQKLEERHRQEIKTIAREVAYAFATGSVAKELEESLIKRSHELRLSDTLPENLSQPMAPEAFLQQIENLTYFDTANYWGLSVSKNDESGQAITEITVRPLEDMAAFQAAYLHEVTHDIQNSGYLPVLVSHELITHAGMAWKLVKSGGIEALRKLGGDFYVELFEMGQRFYEEGKNIEDLDWLLEETEKLKQKYMQSLGRPDEPFLQTQTQAMLNYFEFERLAGTVLGGYAWARELKENKNGLAFIFDYAVHVLGRLTPGTMGMRLTEENLKRIERLRRTIESFARTLTDKNHLEIRDWTKQLTGSDVPEVVYQHHQTYPILWVPPQVWMLDEKVAKGIIAQEIHRITYAKPELIPAELNENKLFTDLWRVADTPRIIEVARQDHPGSVRWIDHFYDYRHRIVPNLGVVQQRMSENSLPYQYLAGILWLWNLGPPDTRITDARVLQALEETQESLIQAFHSSPEQHLKILQEKIWPPFQALFQEAVQDEVKQDLMNQMMDKKELELNEDQKTAHEAGKLRPQDLDDDQKKKLQEKQKQMSAEEKQPLEEKATQKVNQKQTQSQQQMGAQGLGQMMMIVISDQNQSQQGQPQGNDSLFQAPPGMPQPSDDSSSSRAPKGRGDLDSEIASGTAPPRNDAKSEVDLKKLSEMMRQILKEAGDLENLASQAAKTAVEMQGQAENLNQSNGEIEELAKSLDQLAGQLREQAENLHGKAGNFNEQTQQAEVSDSQNRSDISELAAKALELLQKTREFKDQSGHFKTQTERVLERFQDQPESVTPEVSDGLNHNAKALNQQTQEIHKKAENLEQLTQQIVEALGKIQTPSEKPQEQQGQKGQPGKKSSKGQGQAKPAQPEKRKMDFSPKKPESGKQSGGKGYGPGVSESVEMRQPEKTKIPRDKRPPRPISDITQTEKPVSESQRKEAEDIIRRIPKAKPKPPESGTKPKIPADVTDYAQKKALYSAEISNLHQLIEQKIQKTRKKRVRGGLWEGDALDPASLHNVEFDPAEIMAQSTKRGRFDQYWSLLQDVSGSMYDPIPDQPGLRFIDFSSIGAMIFRESLKNHNGIKSEEYAFESKPVIHLRDYHETLTDELASQIDRKILSINGVGTADVLAIKGAIERLKLKRQNKPGLKIIGIGIGAGTKKVKEAYAPNGFQVLTPQEIIPLMNEIFRYELGIVGGREQVPNIILVLTDGNPGAENAALIQAMAKANETEWARSEVRSKSKKTETKPMPVQWITEKVGEKDVEFLVIKGQKMEIGPGGDLTPRYEILSIEELDLPSVENENFPADYVARVELDQGSNKQAMLIPLSEYNLTKLAEMIGVFNLTNNPNLYLWGPAGTGKNTLLYLLAALAKRPAYLQSLHFNTTEAELKAMKVIRTIDGKKNVESQLSPMLQAADDKRGAIGIWDEIDKPQDQGVQMAGAPLADPQRSITLDDNTMIVADRNFRMAVMGNAGPDDHEPIYEVTPPTYDFKRRFWFVELQPLFAPKRKNETDQQEKGRRLEMEFLLRLQAKELYAKKAFYTYKDAHSKDVKVSGREFIEKLVLLAQDTYSAYHKKEIPRYLTVRGLIRIVRRLQLFPDDILNFQEVLGMSYNLLRLRPHEKQNLDTLINNRLPGLLEAAPTKSKLKSKTVPVAFGKETRLFYQILDDKDKLLAEVPVSENTAQKKAKRHYEHQTVLRNKLILMKAINMGEHVLIYGHTGTGKTTITVDFLINDLNLDPTRTGLNPQSTTRSLLGSPSLKDNEMVWDNSPTLIAMDQGRPNVIDELGKPEDQAVISSINNVAAFGQIMTPFGLQAAREGFFIVATTTPMEAIYGVKEISAEVEDRFFLMYSDYMEDTEEIFELQRVFPNLPIETIHRFVGAMRELRTKHKDGLLMRPVAIDDMISTLETFTRDDRTLFEIFLAKFGISKDTYREVVQEVFKKPEYDLFNLHFKDLKPAPTVDQILQAATEEEKIDLLSQLIRTFRGDTSRKKFQVANVAKGGKLEIKSQATSSLHNIEIPAGTRFVPLVYFLKKSTHFSAAEKQTLGDIAKRAVDLNIKVETGDNRIDDILKRILQKTPALLDKGDAGSVLLILGNLQPLSSLVSAGKLSKETVVEVKSFLKWMEEGGIYPEKINNTVQEVLKQVEKRSETRTVVVVDTFGQTQTPNSEGLVPTDPIREDLIQKVEGIFRDKPLPLVLQQSYERLGAGKFYGEPQMQSPAGIGKIEEDALYLNPDLYGMELAENEAGLGQALMVYLHLIYLLARKETPGDEKTKTEVASTLRAARYAYLSPAEKQQIAAFIQSIPEGFKQTLKIFLQGLEQMNPDQLKSEVQELAKKFPAFFEAPLLKETATQEIRPEPQPYFGFDEKTRTSGQLEIADLRLFRINSGRIDTTLIYEEYDERPGGSRMDWILRGYTVLPLDGYNIVTWGYFPEEKKVLIVAKDNTKKEGEFDVLLKGERAGRSKFKWEIIPEQDLEKSLKELLSTIRKLDEVQAELAGWKWKTDSRVESMPPPGGGNYNLYEKSLYSPEGELVYMDEDYITTSWELSDRQYVILEPLYKKYQQLKEQEETLKKQIQRAKRKARKNRSEARNIVATAAEVSEDKVAHFYERLHQDGLSITSEDRIVSSGDLENFSWAFQGPIEEDRQSPLKDYYELIRNPLILDSPLRVRLTSPGSVGGWNNAGVYLGYVKGIPRPVAIKLFKKAETMKDVNYQRHELLMAQINSFSGMGPKFYGIISQNSLKEKSTVSRFPPDAEGYVMQAAAGSFVGVHSDESVEGKANEYYGPDLKRNETLQSHWKEIRDRLERYHLVWIHHNLLITRAGRIAIIDAGDFIAFEYAEKFRQIEDQSHMSDKVYEALQYILLTARRAEMRDISELHVLTPEFKVTFTKLRDQILPRYLLSQLPMRDLVELLSQLLNEPVYSEKAGILPDRIESGFTQSFGQKQDSASQFQKWMEGIASDKGRVLLDAVWLKRLTEKNPRALYILLTALQKFQGERNVQEPLIAVVGEKTQILDSIQYALSKKKNNLNWKERHKAKHFLIPHLEKLIQVVSPESLQGYIESHDYGVATLFLPGNKSLTELPLGAQFFFDLEPRQIENEALVALVFPIPGLLKAAALVKGIKKNPSAQIRILKPYLQQILPGATAQGRSFMIHLVEYIDQVLINHGLVDRAA